jgi:arabinofuranosyltransferase
MQFWKKNWLPILIGLVAIAARIIPGPRTVDDAFITYRYAQNLLAGHGLVYNPGQAVLGTTTPLFASLLAVIGSVLGGTQAPFPWISLILSAAFDALSCWLLISIGRHWNRAGVGLAAAAVWAVAPMSVTFAIGGMETSLVVLLLLAIAHAHFTSRHKAAALLAALALLTRPDTLLFIAPIGLLRLMALVQPMDDRPTWAEAALFAVPLLAWGAFAFGTYGTPFPNSVAAKSVAYVLPPEAALVRLLQHYATPFLGHLTFGNWWIGVGLLFLLPLYFLGSAALIHKERSRWAMMVYPLVYFIVFAAFNPLLFRWYLTPPLPFYFLGIFAGVNRLASDLKRPAILTVFSILAVLLTLRGWTVRPDHGPSRPAPQMAYIGLEEVYRQVAEDLVAEMEPGYRLAAGDIGVLGYITGEQILDAVGLISPEAVDYFPLPDEYYVANYAMPPDLILEELPDVLVTLEVYVREGLLQDPRFEAQYHLWRTYETDIYGSEGMLVFVRNAAPSSLGLKLRTPIPISDDYIIGNKNPMV